MELNEIKQVRLSKLNQLQENKIYPYGERFERSESIADTLAHFEEENDVVLARRIMAVRSHGKVEFIDIQDQTGKIKLYMKKFKTRVLFYCFVNIIPPCLGKRKGMLILILFSLL